LTWKAATERLEAAGSIPVKEAELMAEALSSKEAGIEVRLYLLSCISTCHCVFTQNSSLIIAPQITLPPLIEDNQGREIVAAGLRRSRARYRQFRSRLSNEVLQSKGAAVLMLSYKKTYTSGLLLTFFYSVSQFSRIA
jgi:hypothetical protein